MLGGAAALVLNAFQSNLVFFFTPSQIVANEAPQGRAFRVGGLVEEKSLAREQRRADRALQGHRHRRRRCRSSTRASSPTCSRKARASSRRGRSAPTASSSASEVLAKHDENYMPPEAADAVNKAHGAAAVEKTAKTLQR